MAKGQDGPIKRRLLIVHDAPRYAMLSPTAFPWTAEGEGLCNVLRDAELWALAFKDDRDFCADVVYKLGPKTRGAGLVPEWVRKRARRKPPDPQRFGALLVGILPHPRKRERLADFIKQGTRKGSWRGFLGFRLLRHVTRTFPFLFGQSQARPLEELEELDPAGLQLPELTSDEEIPSEQQRPLALLACAFALLHPRNGVDYLQHLYERSATLRELLCDGSPPLEENPPEKTPQEEIAVALPTSVDQSPETRDTSLPFVTGGEPVTMPTPSPLSGEDAQLLAVLERESIAHISLEESSRVVTLLRRKNSANQMVQGAAEELRRQLAADQVGPQRRQAQISKAEAIARLAAIDREVKGLLDQRVGIGALFADQLRQGLERTEQEYRQFEEAVARLRTQLQQVSRLTWFEAPFAGDNHLSFPNRCTLREAHAALDIRKGNVSRILQADSSLRDLVQRLAIRSTPLVGRDVTDLAEIAECLERNVASYQRRFEEMAAREKGATEFFERFVAVVGRESGQRLIEQTLSSRWEEVGRFVVGTPPCTEAGRRYGFLVGRIDLAGLIAAHIWQGDPSTGSRLIASILANRDLSRDQRVDLLAFLSFAQLQELGTQHPKTAADIADLIFAVALSSAEPSALAYLEPLREIPSIPPACANLYAACLAELRAGSPITIDRLHETTSVESSEGRTRRAEEHRQRLLNMIQQRPTLTHNYYRLRLAARDHFLEPLTAAVSERDFDRAWRQWQDAGNLERIAEECISLSGLRRRELDRSHYEQTLRFLESFENELRQWCSLQGRHVSRHEAALGQALMILRREAESGRNTACVHAFETIGLLRKREADSALPPADFGQRLTMGDGVGPLLLNVEESVNRLMTWSWPLAVKQGRVPLALLLGDRLREALGTAPQTLDDAVDQYLQQGEFVAAREAAAGEAILTEKVLTQLETRKEDLRTAHATLLAEANTFKEHDPDIEFWLQEISRGLDTLEFETVGKLFQELETCVGQVRALRDPARLRLLEFLREASVQPDESASRETLEQQVDFVKRRNAERRLHLLELEKVGTNSSLPELLRERWSGLANRFDRPSCWPSEESAFEAAWSIGQFVTFLTGHLEDRESDPGSADLFARFSEWLPGQFGIDPTFAGPAGKTSLAQVTKLAQDIEARRSDRAILRGLGSCDPPVSAAAGPPALTGPPAVNTAPVVRTHDHEVDADEIQRHVREFLLERMKQEEHVSEAAPATLRSAVRGYRWAVARRVAAELTLGQKDIIMDRSGPLSDVEAVYAVALAYSIQPDDRTVFLSAQQSACLAAFATEQSQFHYYIPPMLLKEQELAPRALVLATGIASADDTHGPALSEQLGQAFARLIDLAPADQASEWLRELFWKASRITDYASPRLAGQLWESLRGKDNDEPRSCLLRLLFRWRRREALRHLTRQAEPLDDLIRACLSAFEQAEEDSAIRPQAHELLLTLREQAFGKRNTKPWINLFQHLGASRGDAGEAPVRFTLESEGLGREVENGPAVVQVLLTPSLADPPRSLVLHFHGGDQLSGPGLGSLALVNEDEMLLKPKAIEITIPQASLIATGDVIDVAYRLTGETILRKPIESSGRWTFPNTYHNLTLLDSHALASAWPGASGDPVSIQGFHGREDEQLRVERYLGAPGRGRSLMVFGQRRIGKTSLLLSMVRNSPPRLGGICGVFFDFNGLDTPAGPGAMQKAFFSFILSKLTTEPINEPVRQAMNRATGRPMNLDVLVKGLHAEIALEDALEGLVQRLEHESRGLISRVAFFFDEFDRFVEPLLAGQREEVLKLHGSLRQIVQRSHRITLVLAGSGLQRLFTEDYLHPFYGSIDELELKPFEWSNERGRAAVMKTFLPAHLRAQLCPGDRFTEVAHRAADLTGGHPYYLAMLGFAAARAWRGHALTPDLLNRVADLMIQNKIEGGTFDVNRKKFYQFIFESLKRLSERERAIARLTLASIARLTSTERQRWKKWKLIEDQFIEDPDVRRLTTEDERLTALKYLEKERVLEFDNDRSGVRIRIPLAAAAIREDARDIHIEALRELRKAAGGVADDRD